MSTLFEYRNATDTQYKMFSINHYAQTFTALSTHSFTSIKLRFDVYGSPADEDMLLNVYATAAGVPAGPSLANASVNSSNVAGAGTTELEFTLNTELSLTSGVKYAITIQEDGSGWNSNNCVRVKGSVSSGDADNEKLFSNNGGSSWYQQSPEALFFEVYGTGVNELTGTGSGTSGSSADLKNCKWRRILTEYMPSHEGNIKNFTVQDLTASRLVGSDANKKLESVADLTNYIAGTANQVIVTDDGDGSITLSTPQDIDTDCDFVCDTVTAETVDLTNITDNNIPYISAAGFTDSPITTDGTDVVFSGDISADTADLTDITDGNLPYMSASGFADSPIKTDGTNVCIGEASYDALLHINGNKAASLKITNSQGSGVAIDLTDCINGYALDIGNNQFIRFSDQSGNDLHNILGVSSNNETYLLSMAGEHLNIISGSGKDVIIKAAGTEYGRFRAGGGFYITETAGANGAQAGKGQFYVKNDTPNIPMFADDAGTPFYIAISTAGGWSGTFTNGDGDTVTVENGIITNVA